MLQMQARQTGKGGSFARGAHRVGAVARACDWGRPYVMKAKGNAMSVNGTTMTGHGARRMLAAALALVLALACAVAAGLFSPRQAVADDPDATLTLVVKYNADTPDEVNVDGMTLSAYKVAEYGEGNNYYLVDAYSAAGPSVGVDADFNKVISAEDANKLAVAMAEIAEAREADASATSGTDGMAAFGTLDYGVYLIVQTGAQGTAEEYDTLAPFLINVPQLTAEEQTFDVVAYTKPELDTSGDNARPPDPEIPDEPDEPEEPVEPPEPDEPDEPTPDVPDKPSTPDKPNTPTNKPNTPSSTTPKTGDMLQWVIPAAGCGIGVVAMLVAVIAASRLRRD